MAEAQYTLCTAEQGMIHESIPALRRLQAAWLSLLILVMFAVTAVIRFNMGRVSVSPNAVISLAGTAQHVYIVRHGDKYSSYPDCAVTNGTLCYDKELMGDNPPLTPCGMKQAARTAEWLSNGTSGSISNIVVSPFTRTLQTALPLAKSLGKTLQVEYLLSEARQPEGPFREFNINAPGETVEQLQECHRIWNRSYAGPPIKTPENDTLYIERATIAAQILKERFPPSSGDLVVVTHATTAFSIAYGLCYSDTGNDGTLEEFVNAQNAIGPAGVIHVAIEGDGSCTIEQTRNVGEAVNCGRTPAYKCNFSDFPAWYWAHKGGKGPGKCA